MGVFICWAVRALWAMIIPQFCPENSELSIELNKSEKSKNTCKKLSPDTGPISPYLDINGNLTALM